MTTLLEKGPHVNTVAFEATPVRGIPFTRIFHVELRKQLDTRAGRTLLIIIGAVAVLVLTVMVWVSDVAELNLMSLFDNALIPQAMILPVLGILAMTSEWSQRTGMTTFTQESQRSRVIAAKIVSTFALGAVVIVVTLGLAALANLVAIVLRDAPGVWSFDWPVFGATGLLELILIAQGLAFGLLLLNTPAAIVTYYVLPTVWLALLSAISWLEPVREWLDLTMASTALAEITEMSGTEWAKLLVTLAIWIGLPLVLGTVRVLRREVK